jgi:hypothetical protein
MDLAFDEAFLLSEVERMAALIEPHLLEGQNLTKFGWDVERVREFIQGRRAAVLANVADGPADWPWPHNGVPCFTNSGEVKATFDTVWGSLKDESMEGIANYEVYVIDGETLATTGSAVAGIETEGQAANQAVFSLVTQGADGTLDILATIMDPDLVKAGATYGYGEEIDGYRLLLKPPYTQGFDLSGALYWGTFTLDEVSTVEGGTVKGRLDTLIFPLF